MGDDNGWQEGVCKPSNSQPTAVKSTSVNCYPLWYNQCTSNSDCCSGFCFLGENNGWQEGVCKPPPKQKDGNRKRK